MSDDTMLDILYDHYKDSFGHLQRYLRQRDRVFVIVLVTMVLILFQVSLPSEASKLFSTFLSKQLELSTPLNLPFLTTIIWFVLFVLVVRYFQTVVLIEKQYDYIHALEKRLESRCGAGTFTREGKSYLSGTTLFSKWASGLYTITFPALLVLLITTEIIREIAIREHWEFFLVLNCLLYLSTIVSIVLYLAARHNQK